MIKLYLYKSREDVAFCKSAKRKSYKKFPFFRKIYCFFELIMI